MYTLLFEVVPKRASLSAFSLRIIPTWALHQEILMSQYWPNKFNFSMQFLTTIDSTFRLANAEIAAWESEKTVTLLKFTSVFNNSSQLFVIASTSHWNTVLVLSTFPLPSAIISLVLLLFIQNPKPHFLFNLLPSVNILISLLESGAPELNEVRSAVYLGFRLISLILSKSVFAIPISNNFSLPHFRWPKLGYFNLIMVWSF